MALGQGESDDDWGSDLKIEAEIGVMRSYDLRGSSQMASESLVKKAVALASFASFAQSSPIP